MTDINDNDLFRKSMNQVVRPTGDMRNRARDNVQNVIRVMNS